MEPLIDILKRAREQLEPGWLYLPENENWRADTCGRIIDVDNLGAAALDADGEPLVASEEGLVETLDSDAVESIVAVAEDLEDELSEALLLESFLYYHAYDAFLPYPGFVPLPPEAHERQMDRDFYDGLGPERADVTCKAEDCGRGAIAGSRLCRIHHFEMIRNKPCPFAD